MKFSIDKELSDWYVIQTLSGKEDEVKNGLLKYVLNNGEVIYPKRKILIRRRSNLVDTYKSLFPGYIFYKGSYFEKIYNFQNRLNGFIKVITEKKLPVPLFISEIDRIKQLIDVEDTIDYSNLVVAGEKIKVISGPLTDMEGIIKKVDIRKQRVIVELKLFGRPQNVSLSFNMIDKVIK